jgi:D-psicose/D-tagatose/L-ribulose 3-epimerase
VLEQPLYFSFFMFTVDLRPADEAYREQVIEHLRELAAIGYTGFDMPIAPKDTTDHAAEVEEYLRFKQALDDAGLGDLRFTTNMAATERFDPTAEDPARRREALDYLKSRVDITAALGGDIMAGPVVFPYNVFPVSASSAAMWGDELRDWMGPGYGRARPVLHELADYAAERGVKVAIEAVDRWETPGPNSVREVLDFLADVPSPQIGVCVDSAHVVLGDDGPEASAADLQRAVEEQRLHYVHLSAPARGGLRDSWIPWRPFLEPILDAYAGPFLVETFNALPVFLAPLHLTRRKYWIPGEDPEQRGVPDAYTVAREAIETVRQELAALRGLEVAVPDRTEDA